MKNQWSDRDANAFLKKYANQWGKDMAWRTYSSRLLGGDMDLVLPGGGNTSVKGAFTNILGEKIPAIYVKASGWDLATIEPAGYSPLDLKSLRQLTEIRELGDEILVNETRLRLLNTHSANPSIETLMHALIPEKYIDHTHPESILILSNMKDGKKTLKKVLGDKVLLLDYIKPGFSLALAAAAAFKKHPHSLGMILMKHGLVTWGKNARTSYDRTIELVNKAEAFITKKTKKPINKFINKSINTVVSTYEQIAPIIRGCLAFPTGNPDWPHQKMVLRPLISGEILHILNPDKAPAIFLTPPLTTDYLIRAKPLPLLMNSPDLADPNQFRKQFTKAVSEYSDNYQSYFERNFYRMTSPLDRMDPMPRIILIPGLGVVCAGKNITEAELVRNIAAQTLRAKTKIAQLGTHDALSEEHLFDMEYSYIQHAKLKRKKESPLSRSIALVSGAAGAIGTGICQELLENGCHVAITDLPGEHLDSIFRELQQTFGDRVIAAPLDVTDPESVRQGFNQVIQAWGGIDLVIANAGIAQVAALTDLDLKQFQKVSQVNVDGTLNVIAQAGRLFRLQGTGGDIILISTKNVFAPGAKFGAYSATKAAAHQIARIASLELAELGVRVNMVSPDAVFSHQNRKSGLWATVGPDRMRARGLDEQGLEEYYQRRNLLKARVTAKHVANAVLFFATHQTPTTGATIPVDGGLPEATPR